MEVFVIGKIKKNTTFILVIYSFLRVISRSNIGIDFPPIENFIDLGGIVCLLIMSLKVLNKRYKKDEILILLFLFFILLLNFYIAKNNSLLISAIMILSFNDVDLKKILLSLYRGIALGFFGVIILTRLKVINTSLFYLADGMRDTLGFTHPNTTGQFLFVLVLLYLYLNYEKINMIRVVFILTVVSVIQLEIHSRTSLFVTLLAVFLFVISKSPFLNKVLFKKAVILLGNVMLISGFLMSYIIPQFYGKYNWTISLNSVMSGRIKYSRMFLEKYPINILGHKIEQVSHEGNRGNFETSSMLLDNGFLKILIVNGVLLALVFLIAYLCILNFQNDGLTTPMIISIIVFLLYGFSESIIMSSHLNFTLFFIYRKYREVGVENDFCYNTPL